MKQESFTQFYIKRIMKEQNSANSSKDPVSFIKNNYDKLLETIPEGELVPVIRTLYQYKELKNFMDKKFVLNMSKAKKHSIDMIIEIYNNGRSKEEQDRFLCEKLPLILDQIDSGSLFHYLKWKKVSPKIREKLNQKILQFKEDYIRNYILKNESKDYHLDEDTVYLLTKLIEEILDHEQKDYIDINYLQSGSYSRTFEIGSKILKIGQRRKTYQIPYDKRILQPLIRVDLTDLSPTNIGTIEVCEKVLTDVNLSEEDLYKIYKDFRVRGKVWTDVKSSNIGILLKDNKRHWNTPLGESKRAVGYLEDEFFDQDHEILSAGEPVVLDSDFIYKEDDPYIVWITLLSIEFEKRYQLEIRKSKEK